MATVFDALSIFTGDEAEVSTLFRLVLRETAHLPADHALRGEIDAFYSEVNLVALSLRMGGDKRRLRTHLSTMWAGIMAPWRGH